MSTLNLTLARPNQITGLIATPSVKSVGLTWDVGFDAITYEVWRSYTSDDPTVDAVKIATVETNYYTDDTVTSSVSAYFWVKAVNNVGTTSIFSNGLGPYNLGLYFNQSYLTLRAGDVSTSGSANVSIDNLKAKVFYTTSAGASTDTGLLSFTTTVTQTPLGVIAWTNPNNARVDDGSYATATTTAGNYTEQLIFTIADLGVPNDARVTSIELQLDGKTSNRTNTVLNAYLYTSVAAGWPFATFTANNADEVLTLTKSAADWGLTSTTGVFGYANPTLSDAEVVSTNFDSSSVKGLNGGGYANLIAYDNGGGSTGFTSSNGSNTTAYGLSGVTGFSDGVSSASDIMTGTGSVYGNVPGYGTWYIISQSGTIQLNGTFSPVPLIIECMSQWYYDTIVATPTQTVEVKLRFRLRNTTDSTEVTREFTLFKQTGVQVYAANTNFAYVASRMYPDLSTTPFRLTQNKAYTLFCEVQKNRSTTDTINAHCNMSFLNYSFGR